MAELSLEGLRVCREVALLGSFTAAARSLGYSQPAVSRQVAAMEAAVGYRLFARAVRGVSLTPAGTVVIEHAARILGATAALRHDVDGLGERLAGRVAVGAFPAAMSVLVPRTAAQLAGDYPALAIGLTEGPSRTLVRDLRAGRLDIAVIATGPGLPDYDLDGLVQHRIYAGDMCVAVPADHRLAGLGRVPVRELTDEQWIAGAGSAGDPQFTAWPTLDEPNIRHRVVGWPARLGLVAAGLGICVMPELAALSVPAGVVTIGVDDPVWPGRASVALTPAAPSEEVRAVVTTLRAVADGLRPSD
ncbi:LysR family transcriptional regulator [Mycolicibacterium parafortuitum]|uniref:Probable hydrogen peroxide-inducible genes activator n=1 Tax=Mycolicibacterium parafortuitum TaxID=39692 RepID=A0A7I7U9C4_MYCPF|nr:LysR family transcriptional regulator [Mycolicibacterium parafortuitum]PQE02595.1 LysR family transcriptional regulator [Mycobacterium sp. EPG1]BBY77998.1 LysR family transcriptional regulator [Mycolicibacterium parafortuitum]